MTEVRVVVDGLKDLNKALKAADVEAVNAMKSVMKTIADGVVQDVRSRFPRVTGTAANSYKPRGGVKGAGIAFGGPKAAYAPWLDFGGTLKPTGGRRNTITRPVIAGGRYLYPAIEDNMENIAAQVADAIDDITRQYGFRVEGTD